MHKKGFVYLVGAAAARRPHHGAGAASAAKLRRGGLRRPHRSGPAGAGRARGAASAGKRVRQAFHAAKRDQQPAGAAGPKRKDRRAPEGRRPRSCSAGAERNFWRCRRRASPVRKCRGFLLASRFAAAGIPVTHRGASRSFHVITGHTAQTATRCRNLWRRWRRCTARLCF